MASAAVSSAAPQPHRSRPLAPLGGGGEGSLLDAQAEARALDGAYTAWAASREGLLARMLLVAPAPTEADAKPSATLA